MDGDWFLPCRQRWQGVVDGSLPVWKREIDYWSQSENRAIKKLRLSKNKAPHREMRDLSGSVFGRLTVVGFSHRNKRYWWKVKCRCGGERIVRGDALRSGKVTSCGCWLKEQRKLLGGRYGVLAREKAKNIVASGMKNCVSETCLKANPQPLENFHKSSRHLDGRTARCKTCSKDKHLKRIMGIDFAKKQEAIISQGGKCANARCDNPATHADHNHETGRFRAVLCMRCNTLEGLMNDTDRILGLIEYRKRHDSIDYPADRVG